MSVPHSLGGLAPSPLLAVSAEGSSEHPHLVKTRGKKNEHLSSALIVLQCFTHAPNVYSWLIYGDESMLGPCCYGFRRFFNHPNGFRLDFDDRCHPKDEF